MKTFKAHIKMFVSLLLLIGLLPLSGFTQTSPGCETGKLDDRVASFLKKLGPDRTLVELKAMPIEKIKNDGPLEFEKIPEDRVKRIRITKDNIAVNVVKAKGNDALPVIINFHGGGFVKPLQPWMEYEAMVLADQFNAVVFDVDYRVAPEYKFPTAVNDAYNAYKWVVEHAKEYGGDASKIILTGKSSGANLIALITHKAKKEGTHKPIKLVIMNSAPTDNPKISYYDSYETNAKGYGLTKDNAIFCFEMYLDKSEWYKNNPEIWPLHAADVSGLPPTLIILAEFDILRDEGLAYGRKLEKAGNQVQILCYPHQIHSLIGLPNDAAERKQLLTTMGDAIKKALQ